MKHLTITMASVLMLAGWARAGTIVYSYDEQQRLTGANYGNQATVTYEYDKADNLIGYTVLTDSQYFKPFLLCFTQLRDDSARPKCYRES
jgi:YD repeat-containing protein